MNLRTANLPFGPLVFLLIVACSAIASAGEIHEGYGSTKLGAMKQANDVAKGAAAHKETCWKPALIRECKKDADGYWTAYAYSANHLGSCGRGGYLSPSASVGLYDDGSTGGAPSPGDQPAPPSPKSGGSEGEDQQSGSDSDPDNNRGNSPEDGMGTGGERGTGPGRGRLGTNDQSRQQYLFIAVTRKPNGNCFREELVVNKVEEATGRESRIRAAFCQQQSLIHGKTFNPKKCRVIPRDKWTYVFSYNTKPSSCTNTTIGIATGDSNQEARNGMADTLRVWEATNNVIKREWPVPQVRP
jgi:hypothetical protein